mgnify:CR=1 FL=1
MPKSLSARKRARQNLKRRERNQAVKSAIKTIFKKAELMITEQPEDSAEVVKKAISLLDRAAAKRIIHPNKSARKKSRLMKKLNQKLSQENKTPAKAPE